MRPRLLAILFYMTNLKSLDYSNVYVYSNGNNPLLLPIHKYVNGRKDQLIIFRKLYHTLKLICP